ncbi:MAG TPA: 3D domain-containing protein [Caulobacteraceae bacterium]|nr:3D domain-containing protein [Caulobacteraceae bacterium]
MKRTLACLAALTLMAAATGVNAQTANPQKDSASDPLGDLIAQVAQPVLDFFNLKATLYHQGNGIGSRDSLGCKVVPMRTAAVDGVIVPRHTLLFIKETVGMLMPDGSRHDGYWYATDVGGGIHAGRIDLFTGAGSASMKPLMPLNLKNLTVAKVGKFEGCPKG